MNLKAFRHICFDESAWEYFTNGKAPEGCPNVPGCGEGWEEIDLSMFPEHAGFMFLINNSGGEL